MKAISMKPFIKITLNLALICWFILTSSIPGLSQKNTGGSDIVIIDSTLQDVGILINSLKPGTKLFYLDKSEQLVTFISETVINNAPVKSLHLLTHGAPGAIFTTSTFINYEILNKEKGEISKWKESFTSDGAILFYGCDVGKGESGKSFIDLLSAITGLNILASTDKTGSSKQGGNWELEIKTGSGTPGTCFNSGISEYNNLLAKALVWYGDGYFSGVNTFYNSQAGNSSVYLSTSFDLPDLSTFSLVFIGLPTRDIKVAEITALKAFLERGGRIVVVGENSYFAAQNDIITRAIALLGGHLSIQSLLLDQGSITYLPVTHINTSFSLMEGVTSLNTSGAVSAINIGGDATYMMRSYSDPTKIIMAHEKIGNGDLVAWADINNLNTSSATNGMGRLLMNILTGAAERIQNSLVATVLTTEAYIINESSASSGGNIVSDNGSAITERGICWSASTSTPITSGNKIVGSGTGKGLYTAILTGLSLNTKYYIRAYAINEIGTAYGNTVIFTTPSVVNYIPTAVADKFNCQRSGTITGNVMLNDYDYDKDPITAKIVTTPSYITGSFTLNADGTFTYINNGNAASSDYFTYYLTDGKSNSAPVGVSIAIFTPSILPVSSNSAVTVDSKKPYSFSATEFTFSDEDAGHTFNGIRVVTLPAKGVLKYDGFAIAAGAICNDVTRMTYEVSGATGSDTPFTTFTFKVIASSAEESASDYTMSVEKLNTPGMEAATVTLSNLSQTYTGSALSVTVVTEPANLTVNVTYNGSTDAPSAPGTYSLVATIVNDQYEGSATGNLVISKAILTATAENESRSYGASNPELLITYSGFVNGESISDIDTKPVASTEAVANSSAGTYSITPAGGTDNNYEITNINGTLTISKAQLTATAENKTKVYGQNNPELTLIYSGFVTGESQNVLDSKPEMSTLAAQNSNVGEFDIAVSGGSDNNYNFIYAKGILTISKADQTINFEDIPADLRMTQEHLLVATASSGLSVSFVSSNLSTVSISGDIMSVKGTGTSTITAKQAGNNNYNSAADVSQTVQFLPSFDNSNALFTPNNDGVNDYWVIPKIDELGTLHVKVYSRNGLLVYESTNYTNNWEGTWKNLPLPAGSYYYIIDSSEKGSLKGVVNIIR